MRIDLGIMPTQRAKLANLVMAVILLTGLDQLVKFGLAGLKAQPIVHGLFRLVWYENIGIAFSLPLPYWIAVGLIILVLLILIKLWWQAPGQLAYYRWGLLLAIGGGLSNLVDKLSLGFVRDFVSIWILPVFNLADVFIFVGVVLIIVGAVYDKRYQKI